MNIQVLLLILSSVGLSVLAQVALKYGMSQPYIQMALGQGGLTAAWLVITNMYVFLGLFMYGCGAMLWLLVLARLDVSMAYPFVGLGFIFTMLLGFFVLGEAVSVMRVVGTLLITAGVVLVSLT